MAYISDLLEHLQELLVEVALQKASLELAADCLLQSRDDNNIRGLVGSHHHHHGPLIDCFGVHESQSDREHLKGANLNLLLVI